MTFKSTDLPITNPEWIKRIGDHGLVSPSVMLPGDALAAIKTLRDVINNTAFSDPETGWQNDLLDLLDRAADTLEFPSDAQKARIEEAYVG
jgi:hypothetical protein